MVIFHKLHKDNMIIFLGIYISWNKNDFLILTP